RSYGVPSSEARGPSGPSNLSCEFLSGYTTEAVRSPSHQPAPLGPRNPGLGTLPHSGLGPRASELRSNLRLSHRRVVDGQRRQVLRALNAKMFEESHRRPIQL